MNDKKRMIVDTLNFVKENQRDSVLVNSLNHAIRMLTEDCEYYGTGTTQHCDCDVETTQCVYNEVVEEESKLVEVSD